ncbi:hypothetical protein B0T24DRAFT_236188 [Lasiosphaeria ovina]|uniref:Uncharacterized protein n=1 Tax=Lasiosphaeria ovina TaxID=92902 RepID=A0AAE0KIZ5_9PEZI|nr:hypothetical protein B0T24DRAFT_236188 [Lasiosphaeria ovina]
MPLHIKGRCGGKAFVSLVTMRDAAFNIIQDCKFKHESFSFSGRASSRLASILESLVKAGTLTRAPVREEKLWIMHDVVGRMTTALLREALVHGTRSWEVTIQRCLALCLMAALCCRAGEVSRSNLYQGMETLCYEHITVHLEPAEPPRDPPPATVAVAEPASSLPPPRPRFVASFELRYRKGEKIQRLSKRFTSRNLTTQPTIQYAPSSCF